MPPSRTPPILSRPTHILTPILLSLLLSAAFTRAAPPPPAYVPNEAAAWKGYPVASLKVSDLPGDLADQLRSGLALAAGGGLFGGGKPRFYPATLDEDLRRAALLLARRGYPRAVLSVGFAGADNDESVAIVLTVEPGEPVLVRSLALEGLPEKLTTVQRDRAHRLVQTAAGRVFDDDLLEVDRLALVALLRDAGHASAQVVPRVDWVDSLLVDVALIAEPGPLMWFGAVDPGPIAADLKPLVRHSSGLRSGDLYSTRALQQAEENIRRLELFRQVRLDTRPATAETLDVVAELQPAPMRTLSTSVGWWTEDQVRLAAAWKDRNLLRAGRGLGVQASYSRFRQDAGVTAWRPAFPGPRSGVSVTLGLSYETEAAYTLHSAKLTTALSWRPTFIDLLGLSLSFGRQSLHVGPVANDAFLERDGNLTLLSGFWSRDGADDRLHPTRGGVSRAKMAVTPPGRLSDFHFLTAEVERIQYRPLGRAVLAARAGLGWGLPLAGDLDLPPNVRFFAGGSTSMRGFKRRRLGPVDAVGEPLGGEARLIASAEVRLPVKGRVQAAVFVDAGQAWARHDDIDLGELEVAVGPGLMVNSPVGPLRADLGFRLTDVVPDQPRMVLHVSVGHPF
ncbi:MAG: BamA/TamA family outer membrane protein [Candidatus Latescibacteria bacterium]|nr:BamA/TamA family outer membrane protein [Candidatus Latescibacterota bacterium]